MYKIEYSDQFFKDLKYCEKKRRNMKKFISITNFLAEGQKLPGKYKDHALKGNWQSYRECHIERDWLLIYKIDEEAKEIEYVRMGTHDKLFK